MKNSLPYFFFSFFFLTTLSLKGQMESFPCKNSNPELKNLFKGQIIKSLNVHECYGPGLGNLSSSFLMPSGPAPKIIEDTEGGPPNDDAYVNWTCTYTVGKITDNDPKTAWVEGVKGYGTGEVIIVPCLDLTKPVKIWAGYGKSEAVYSTNSRPKKVRGPQLFRLSLTTLPCLSNSFTLKVSLVSSSPELFFKAKAMVNPGLVPDRNGSDNLNSRPLNFSNVTGGFTKEYLL